MTRAEALAILADLGALAPEARRAALAALPAPAVRALAEEWWWQAHGGQREPGGDWRVWAIVAGRGFGKTRVGAEWVWARAREHPAARIALVAASLDEVARVMVEGESGLLALARCDEAPRWIASRGLLRFPSGAEAYAFTAEKPDKLRGPQHHFAWCDELAKWPAGGAPGRARADATWDNLMLGLRLGERPRTIVTTTPGRAPLLTRILAIAACAVTRGSTYDNPHLPADFRAAVETMYAGTRLGRQELDGLLLDDHAGALWTRDMLDQARAFPSPCKGESAGSAMPPAWPEQRGALFTEHWARSRSEWEGEGPSTCLTQSREGAEEIYQTSHEAAAPETTTSQTPPPLFGDYIFCKHGLNRL